MRSIKNYMYILAMIVLLASCQTLERFQLKSRSIPKDASFEYSLRYFKQGQYEKSLSSIDHFLSAYPQTPKLIESLYLKGRNHRFLKQYVPCLETFRRIVELTKSNQTSYYNYSLYQSGICYEMLGSVDEAIAVYQDALRSKASLPAQLRDLEIPSRLAICYSRTGETQVSKKYSKQLNDSLKEYLKNKSFTPEEKEFYAEILFSMSVSDLTVKDQQDFNAMMDSMEISKQTLGDLLGLSLAPYSAGALLAYIENYKKLYEYIQNLRPTEGLDPILQRRNLQKFQKKLALRVLESITLFEQDVFPESLMETFEEPFKMLKEIKAQYESVVGQNLEGDGLTEEARSKEGIQRKGRVIDKPTALEENSLKESP